VEERESHSCDMQVFIFKAKLKRVECKCGGSSIDMGNARADL
jgi:hypothetical protein